MYMVPPKCEMIFLNGQTCFNMVNLVETWSHYVIILQKKGVNEEGKTALGSRC